MKLATKILISAWALEAAGVTYALAVPVGEASAWVLLPTDLLGLPLITHFATVALQPLEAEPRPPRHKVIVDGVEYIPRAESTILSTNS